MSKMGIKKLKYQISKTKKTVPTTVKGPQTPKLMGESFMYFDDDHLFIQDEYTVMRGIFHKYDKYLNYLGVCILSKYWLTRYNWGIVRWLSGGRHNNIEKVLRYLIREDVSQIYVFETSFVIYQTKYNKYVYYNIHDDEFYIKYEGYNMFKHALQKNDCWFCGDMDITVYCENEKFNDLLEKLRTKKFKHTFEVTPFIMDHTNAECNVIFKDYVDRVEREMARHRKYDLLTTRQPSDIIIFTTA